MELKKSPKADLQNKRGFFLEIGLLLSIGLVILAFNWSQTSQVVEAIDTQIIAAEQEIVEITREPPKNTEPRANIQFQSEVLNLVKDDVKILVDPTFVDLDEDRPIVIPNGRNEGGAGDGEGEVFVRSEFPPEFQGGDLNKFRDWVERQLSNNYPAEAKRAGIVGTVMVSFVIDQEGKVGRVTVIQSPNPILTDAVLKVINASPRWKPGRQGRRAVSVLFSIPVEFALTN